MPTLLTLAPLRHVPTARTFRNLDEYSRRKVAECFLKARAYRLVTPHPIKVQLASCPSVNERQCVRDEVRSVSAEIQRPYDQFRLPESDRLSNQPLEVRLINFDSWTFCQEDDEL